MMFTFILSVSVVSHIYGSFDSVPFGITHLVNFCHLSLIVHLKSFQSWYSVPLSFKENSNI